MRIWIKATLAVLAIAALLWLVVKIGGLTLSILAANSGASGEPDPQFAEAAETVTPPPALAGEDEGCVEHKDNSANWDTSVQTPVDQTADELEAAARAEN